MKVSGVAELGLDIGRGEGEGRGAVVLPEGRELGPDRALDGGALGGVRHALASVAHTHHAEQHDRGGVDRGAWHRVPAR